MKKLYSFCIAAILLALLTPMQGQVVATQRAGFNLPIGQVPAPNTPGGGVVIGNDFYASDAANGFRHYVPAGPANPDPINNGFLVFDNAATLFPAERCIWFRPAVTIPTPAPRLRLPSLAAIATSCNWTGSAIFGLATIYLTGPPTLAAVSGMSLPERSPAFPDFHVKSPSK